MRQASTHKGLRCEWCGANSRTFIKARAHRKLCPVVLALGFDLETKVRNGKLTLVQAQEQQAQRPELQL